MTVLEMIRGLVRCAEFKEQEENGKIWDSSCRDALQEARRRGWGRHQIGHLGEADGRCFIVTYCRPQSEVALAPPEQRVVLSKLEALDAVREWVGDLSEQGKRVAGHFLDNEGETWVWFSTGTPNGIADGVSQDVATMQLLVGRLCFVRRGTIG
ncbi:MAG TPA: hypothetical protein VGM94_01165 [Galbitalea sp.]|jgi:hypothetical protein